MHKKMIIIGSGGDCRVTISSASFPNDWWIMSTCVHLIISVFPMILKAQKAARRGYWEEIGRL